MGIKWLWYWKNPVDWYRRWKDPLYLPKKLFIARYIAAQSRAAYEYGKLFMSTAKTGSTIHVRRPKRFEP